VVKLFSFVISIDLLFSLVVENSPCIQNKRGSGVCVEGGHDNGVTRPSWLPRARRWPCLPEPETTVLGG
jgi:hypothetical protein